MEPECLGTKTNDQGVCLFDSCLPVWELSNESKHMVRFNTVVTVNLLGNSLTLLNMEKIMTETESYIKSREWSCS